MAKRGKDKCVFFCQKTQNLFLEESLIQYFFKKRKKNENFKKIISKNQNILKAN